MLTNLNILKKYIQEKILIIAHHNADPDAICSAYGFKILSETLNPKTQAKIYMPGGISRLSKKLITELQIELEEFVKIENFSSIFILDTASYNQLGILEPLIRETEKAVIFIDHHTTHSETISKADLYIHNEQASSTCEIVATLYKQYDIIPQVDVAKALILGILYDSKHLNLATPNTLRITADLLETSGQLRSFRTWLLTKPTNSERIARLKAAQRTKLHYVENWIIATSEISSFHASAARGLVNLGVDVAIVSGKNKQVLKLSMRSTDHFFSETGIHLGRDISLPLGSKFIGSGSGHPTAAGFNGKGEVTEVIFNAVSLLTERINRSKRVDALF